VCLLRGTDWTFNCNSCYLSLYKTHLPSITKFRRAAARPTQTLSTCSPSSQQFAACHVTFCTCQRSTLLADYLYQRDERALSGNVRISEFSVSPIMIYDMIYLLTAIGLPPGGSSTVHIYTQTIHITTQKFRSAGRVPSWRRG
jgi:hypothetical protein